MPVARGSGQSVVCARVCTLGRYWVCRPGASSKSRLLFVVVIDRTVGGRGGESKRPVGGAGLCGVGAEA